MKKINRRKFIGQAGCGAMGYATLFSSIMNLKAINALAAPKTVGPNDYKALVCIMLDGGNDSFNMLVPMDISEHNVYSQTRSNLALDRNSLNALTTAFTGGRPFGVHPSMPELQGLFNDGSASFVANIGTLVEPMTKADFYNESVRVPLGLFSHSDQIQQWQTGIPNERNAIGWGGKLADIIMSQNSNQNISMNISLGGTNTFQLGNQTVEYAINPYGGSTGIYGYAPDNMYDAFNLLRTAAVDSLFSHTYQDVYKQTYAGVVRNAQDAHIMFEEALENGPSISTNFSDSYTSRSFEMIARTIAVREQLGMSRQIFFLRFGGWDHHDELLQNQMYMLNELSIALSEFHTALNELNMLNNVTTFSISEFARTLTSNGNGTDHAWGGNVFVMGGNQVNGSRIYGDYPILELGGDLEVFDGVLLPTTSTDAYFAELAMWFGLSQSEVFTLFPNLANFYTMGSSTPPIGIINY